MPLIIYKTLGEPQILQKNEKNFNIIYKRIQIIVKM